MVVYRIAGRIPVRFVPVLLFRDICLNGSKQQCQSQRLTVHLKVNGKTSFPLSGSASVKESRPSTTLEVFPKEHDPVLVTLLWYSFRHNLKNVLHGVEQRPVTGERAPPPQHSSLDSSPRGFTISKTCSSKKPEPWAHCSRLSSSRKNCNKYPWVMLLHNNRHMTLHIITTNSPHRAKSSPTRSPRKKMILKFDSLERYVRGFACGALGERTHSRRRPKDY
jgi:hypothetical protein